MQIPFERQKYIDLLKSQGYSVALSALQKDILKWEAETFEGSKNYQPQIWEDLRTVRAFSRELWDQSVASTQPLV